MPIPAFCRRADHPGTGHRTAPVVPLRLRDRRRPCGAHVLDGRHPDPERHRRAALAQGAAWGVRTQRRPATGGSRVLATLVDGTGAPARTGRADVTDTVECRNHGRNFTSAEMTLLRELIAGTPAMSRHALSREFCRRIAWTKPGGGLKDVMARVVMLAMHKDGRIELPPPRCATPCTPAPPGGLDGALPNHPGADRNLRRDPALYRRRLPGVRLDPCRRHPGARALRHEENRRQAEKRHLAATPAQGLEAHPQPLESARTPLSHRTT